MWSTRWSRPDWVDRRIWLKSLDGWVWMNYSKWFSIVRHVQNGSVRRHGSVATHRSVAGRSRCREDFRQRYENHVERTKSSHYSILSRNQQKIVGKKVSFEIATDGVEGSTHALNVPKKTRSRLIPTRKMFLSTNSKTKSSKTKTNRLTSKRAKLP